MNYIDDLIRNRLNKLRAETHITYAKQSSSLPPQNNKSSVEEVEFLLKELSTQTELEEKIMSQRLDVDSQIRFRLEKLKAESASLVGQGQRLPTHICIEAKDNVTPPPTCVEELSSNDSGETCVMCESTPTLSCNDCYNDLYCSKCFTECHDAAENHKTKAITSSKK